MDIALYMGKVIYCDLTYGNMTGWSYWTAFAQEKWGQKNRFHLIRLNATDDTVDESYADIKQGGILTADKNLWVLGNYSYFVRPGYQRVQVEGADELNGLMGSAWLSPNAETLVAVFVNMDKGSREVSLTLEGFDLENVNTYVTDISHNLQLDPNQQDAANLRLPSRSVVTVVMKSLGDPDGITTVRNEDNTIIRKNTYDLSGRQMTNGKLPKGVYIKNGQKLISK